MSEAAAVAAAPPDPHGDDQAIAFRVDEVDYRWAEVFAAARQNGDLDILHTEVRQAQALLVMADADDSVASRKSEREAQRAFRRARRLHAGEDLEAWLGERGVSLTQWRDYIRGQVLRHAHASQLDAVVEHHPPPDVAVRAALPVWGACSGAFARWASELATRVAVAHAVCEDDPATSASPSGPGEPDQLDAGYARFAETVATRRRLEALVTSRYLEWLRVDCDLAVLPDEDVAREARLCVRDEGWSLSDATRAGRGSVHRKSLLMEEVDSETRPVLVGAREGALLGPLALPDAAMLVHVHRKTPPQLDDEEIAARATSELVTTAADREVAARVEPYYPD